MGATAAEAAAAGEKSETGARGHRSSLRRRRHAPREGISGSEAYRAVTLRGVPTAGLDEATGLELERPEALEILLYSSFAGAAAVAPMLSRNGNPNAAPAALRKK